MKGDYLHKRDNVVKTFLVAEVSVSFLGTSTQLRILILWPLMYPYGTRNKKPCNSCNTWGLLFDMQKREG